MLRQHKLKRLSVTINRPIQISPLALDLYIGFVNTPRTQCWAFTSLCLIRNLRRVSNNPPLHCRMINLYATLSHKFLEIAIGNGIAHIENSMKDDLLGK